MQTTVDLDAAALPVYVMMRMSTYVEECWPAEITRRIPVTRPHEPIAYKYNCRLHFTSRLGNKVDTITKYIDSNGTDWFFNAGVIVEVISEERFHAEVAKLWLSV